MQTIKQLYVMSCGNMIILSCVEQVALLHSWPPEDQTTYIGLQYLNGGMPTIAIFDSSIVSTNEATSGWKTERDRERPSTTDAKQLPQNTVRQCTRSGNACWHLSLDRCPSREWLQMASPHRCMDTRMMKQTADRCAPRDMRLAGIELKPAGDVVNEGLED